MNIYVDIDQTICTYEGKRRCELAVPIMDNIRRVNELYDKGHTISYWTARGTKTTSDRERARITDITLRQLSEWGAKYHKLYMDKPAYDVLIDDKCFNSMWDWSDDSIDKLKKHREWINLMNR